MQLLRPHDDELIGSALSRAMRDFGLNIPRLMEALTGRPLASHSFLVARYPGIAKSFGMSAQELVGRHTMANYSLVFLRDEQRERVLSSVLSGTPNSAWISDIARKVTSTAPALRYCPSCVHSDIALFGQSYWRRAHQLPTVSVCCSHECRLINTDIPMRARLPVAPPELCMGAFTNSALPASVQLAIARWSCSCLNNQMNGGMPWSDWFRDRASAAGYQIRQGTKFGVRLSQDLEQFYGAPFLKEHRCAVDREVGPQWPARLLRSCCHGIEPLKHVLLGVFLESDPVPTPPEPKVFKKRGPRRDSTQEDMDAVKRVTKAASALGRRGGKLNLTIVLRKAGLEDLWRHSYPRLPRMQAWVAEFKATEQYKRWVKGSTN